MCGLWVRNGLQIKGQAMTYIQCHFCKSMVDADLFLLQVCSTQLPTKAFINTVLDRYGTVKYHAKTTRYILYSSSLRLAMEIVLQLQVCYSLFAGSRFRAG